MFHLCNLFKNLDQFGVASSISFFNNDVKFKTIYGGMLSFLIYTLGFSYFLYLMIMLMTQQIPPIVTDQQMFYPDFRYYRLNSPLFDFGLEIDEISASLRGFEKQGNIYSLNIYSTDLLTSQVSMTPNAPGFKCSTESVWDYFDKVCINLNDRYQTNLIANAKNRTQDTYIDFYINKCDASSNNTSNCLNMENRSYVLGQLQSYWRLTLFTQDVNLQTGEIINIPQDHYFELPKYQNEQSLLFDLKVRKATFFIDTGLLFSKEQKIEVVHSIQLTTTQNQQDDPVTNQSAIAVITYSLDRYEEIIRVTYPKLGQILAELGSIFQALLLAGILMNKFNEIIMKSQIEEALLRIYFPSMNFFQFNYNWRGKLQSIQYKEKLLKSIDFQQIQQFRREKGELLRSKLNYFNILHEISRLQIQLQLKIPRKDLINLQGLGYKMDLPQNLPGLNPKEDQTQLLDYQDLIDVIYQKPKINNLEHPRNKKPDDQYIVCQSRDENESHLNITPPYVSYPQQLNLYQRKSTSIQNRAQDK